MSKNTTIGIGLITIFILLLTACGGTASPQSPAAASETLAAPSENALTTAENAGDKSDEADSAKKPKVFTAALKKTALGWIEIAKMSDTNALPISDGSITFTVYAELPDEARQAGMSSMEEHDAIKKFIELSGIKLEFNHPPENDDGTYFNAMIASGGWPDIIRSNFNAYPGGIVGAIDDGILLDNTDLIYAYAPNFLKAIGNRGDNARRNVMGDDGKILRIGCEIYDIGIPGEEYPGLEGQQNSGIIMRKDWLDDLGLSVPRTIGELTDTLTQFRDKKGAEFPYAASQFLTAWIYDNSNVIASAFGVTIQGYQVTRSGSVQYSRVLPGYKDYLKLMNHWFSKRLIDRGFASRTDDDSRDLFIEGNSGMIVIGNWAIREALQLGKQKDPGFDVVAIQAPRLDDPEARLNLSGLWESGNGGVTFHISSTCGEPVLATKWLDSLYLPEILEIMASFPDFQTVYDINAQKQAYNSPHNLQAWEAWTFKSTSDSRLPVSIALSDGENAQVSRIQSDIDKYSNEMIIKFIYGEADIETGFDSYVDYIMELGLPEVLEIYQNSYNHYSKR